MCGRKGILSEASRGRVRETADVLAGAAGTETRTDN